MKMLLLIIGIPLIIFGVLMMFGLAIELFEGTSNYSIDTDITGLVLIGIISIIGGLIYVVEYCNNEVVMKNQKDLMHLKINSV